MVPTSFPNEVKQLLRCYVYRLIDPRNGDTFYVGRGKGNRVFSHVRDELGTTADVESTKLQRIREIRTSGMEVLHVIHRHGMDDHTAAEVEAALIDAYPEATNAVTGEESAMRGLMHVQQIIERYKAIEASFGHKLLLITVNRSAAVRDLYEAVRYAWKLDPQKACEADYVLAVVQGMIRGAFEVKGNWKEAIADNFPGRSPSPGRFGFDGQWAPRDICAMYCNKRVPHALRRRGASNPVRYVGWQNGGAMNGTGKARV